MAIDPNILQTTNQNTDFLKNLLGTDTTQSFYEYFYQSFLTTANSLPLNSLWMVFIDTFPDAMINSIINGGAGPSTGVQTLRNGQRANTASGGVSYEGWHIANTYNKAVLEGKRTRAGLVIAQSVKVVGDGLNIERKGTTNTGFIQGLVGSGRKPFPTLNVSFAENNVSFVDYVLRPWAIAVSHKSLKEQGLKTNIYVWHLSKMGSGKDLAKRKITVYEDCVPISIEDQEYNYTGGDVLIKRNVEFAFNKYRLESIDNALLKLISGEQTVNKYWQFVTQEADRLKQTLERTLGASSFNELANNLVDKAQSFGENLVAGTVEGLATNTTGAVTTVVNETISSLEGGVQQSASNLTNSVNDSVNETINSITGSEAGSNPATINNPTRDVVNDAVEASTIQLEGAVPAYVEKMVNPDDTPKGFAPPPPSGGVGQPPAINTGVPVEQNDYVKGTDTLSYTDNAIDPDDNVNINSTVSYNKKAVNPNDYVKEFDPLPSYRRKQINKNDYVKNIDKVDYTQKNIPTDDFVKNTTKVPYKLINPSKDDFVKNTDNVDYTSVEIPKDDFVAKNTNIPFVYKPVNTDDAIPQEQQVHPVIVTPTGDFIKNSGDVPYKFVPIKGNDATNFKAKS